MLSFYFTQDVVSSSSSSFSCLIFSQLICIDCSRHFIVVLSCARPPVCDALSSDPQRWCHTHFPLIAGILLGGLDVVAASLKVLVVLLQRHVSILHQHVWQVRLWRNAVKQVDNDWHWSRVSAQCVCGLESPGVGVTHLWGQQRLCSTSRGESNIISCELFSAGIVSAHRFHWKNNKVISGSIYHLKKKAFYLGVGL